MAYIPTGVATVIGNLEDLLRRMPFLSQLSSVALAWDRHWEPWTTAHSHAWGKRGENADSRCSFSLKLSSILTWALTKSTWPHPFYITDDWIPADTIVSVVACHFTFRSRIRAVSTFDIAISDIGYRSTFDSWVRIRENKSIELDTNRDWIGTPWHGRETHKFVEISWN